MDIDDLSMAPSIDDLSVAPCLYDRFAFECRTNTTYEERMYRAPGQAVKGEGHTGRSKLLPRRSMAAHPFVRNALYVAQIQPIR